LTTDKDKSSDYMDLYRHNIENYNKFLAEIWKLFFGGFMYWYNSDTANQLRETYEENYKQFFKNYEEFYKHFYNQKP